MTGAVKAITDKFVDVLPEHELAPGCQKEVRVGRSDILLIRCEGIVYAVENSCPHALLPLTGGRIADTCITCPRHGARFDLKNGKPINSITKEWLKVRSVRIESGMIQILIP